jgi:hypothetical protein
VHRRVDNNTSFALPTKSGPKIETMRESNERIKNWTNPHIQVKAEKNFYQLKDYENLNYVRGTSAFAGFAPQSFDLSTLEQFSIDMQKILGKDWQKWGTEQVTSNFIIANSYPSKMMPIQKYSDHYPPHHLSFENTSFIHFYGAHRYENRLYIKNAKKVIDALLTIK